ncbi:MAG TPA: type II toxin-antitoxin system VapC family toxin [Phycisphaerae bacterium]|nr:type II toxin-antitoxin system VapC family toxin [Phycisphaerae bacterium]
MSFVIDTDTCSAYLKANRAASAKFMQYAGGLHISTLSVSELFAWVDRANSPPKRREKLLELLDGMYILPLDFTLARYAGTLRAGLLDEGVVVPHIDLLIGATSLYHNFTLVTHNVRDYALIPNLRIQDWLS